MVLKEGFMGGNQFIFPWECDFMCMIDNMREGGFKLSHAFQNPMYCSDYSYMDDEIKRS